MKMYTIELTEDEIDEIIAALGLLIYEARAKSNNPSSLPNEIIDKLMSVLTNSSTHNL
jgi:hypothetical protein